MTNILTATPLGAPTPIDARSIERELNALWQETTDNKSPDQRHQVSRTRVLNLIVVTRSAAAAERATEVAAKLTLRHPHRAIVVNALPRILATAWKHGYRRIACCRFMVARASVANRLR